jgi:hypothetical protein
MCDESPAGAGVGAAAELAAGAIAANAIPFILGAAIDVAAAFLVSHWVLVVVFTTLAAILATVGRVVLARVVLRVLGHHVAPCGYDRLKAREAAMRAAKRRQRRPATVRRPALPAAQPVPAVTNRAPLAIEAPRTFIVGEVTGELAEVVVINGTWFPVLGKE